MKKSFRFAFRGFASCVRTERNFRFHLAVTLYVLIGAVILNLSKAEWIAVLLCIGTVTGAEIFNTAIEKLCDALHPGRNSLIGLVKDMTAGAVLMFAAISAAVGALVFFRAGHLRRLMEFIRADTVWAVLLVLSLPVVLYFVFRSYNHDKNSRDHNSRPSQRR